MKSRSPLQEYLQIPSPEPYHSDSQSLDSSKPTFHGTSSSEETQLKPQGVQMPLLLSHLFWPPQHFRFSARAPAIVLGGPRPPIARSAGAALLALVPRLVVPDSRRERLPARVDGNGGGTSAQLGFSPGMETGQRETNELRDDRASNDEWRIAPHRHTHIRGEGAGNRTEQDAGGRGQDGELRRWLLGSVLQRAGLLFVQICH